MGVAELNWNMKNSNEPDKPREDFLTRLRQEILPESGGLGGELRN